ncbi:MAG TPA: NAD(+) synthase, partial [Polyangiaceae bacterium]|nr:NAD(+) synthase [Polyangiaceae bacterium]
YGCEDAFSWPDTAHQSWLVLRALVPATRGLAACFGVVLPFDGRLFNAVALVVDGVLLGLAVKRHLAGDGLHYEPRWFSGWPAGTHAELEFDGRLVPIGDLVFELGGVKLGFEICEDAWVPERPGHELLLADVDVVLNPSASHFAFGKHEKRQRLVAEGARKFGAAYVYANLLGNEAGRAIYDGDAWMATRGELRIEGRRFSFAPFVVTCGVIDVEAERSIRAGLRAERTNHLPPRPVVRSAFRLDDAEPGGLDEAREQELSAPGTVGGPRDKAEAFGAAVALGLRDYLAKSRSRGCVVSLSGGADSAACAVLVRTMVRLGVEELGFEAFRSSVLPGWTGGEQGLPTNEAALVRQLLVTVYQATDNSSEITRSAAAGLARELGSEHHEWNVQQLVDGYRQRVEAATGTTLQWAEHDLTLQNIQARARAPGVWMLANLRGALLLATSNRSEAAVGYATMDGDTAGGLSPLAGIDKAYLRRWLERVESHGLLALPPLVALGAVNRQAPTAELRPLERTQTDEADLMPYEVLDRIERALVLERLAPREILATLVGEFPQWSEKELFGWCQRFYALFTRNQWKRERYAPSFHLDDANLDPKTWLRFPILSGGFTRELRELEQELKRSGD